MTAAKKVLIMDDDPDHLLFCTLVFQRSGCEVLRLHGCALEEFLEIISEFSRDVIFLDHQMRGITALVAYSGSYGTATSRPPLPSASLYPAGPSSSSPA